MEYDPIKKMRDWIIENSVATSQELDKLAAEAEEEAKAARKKGWELFQMHWSG
jgi:TPP-dependent pyruvate/acetoin dehydrogenase alpha subunit